MLTRASKFRGLLILTLFRKVLANKTKTAIHGEPKLISPPRKWVFVTRAEVCRWAVGVCAAHKPIPRWLLPP